MRIIQLTESLTDVETEKLLKRKVNLEEHTRPEFVVRDTCQVLKPDGSTLLIYLKDVIPRNLCVTAFDVLKKVDVQSGGTNRGNAAGLIEDNEDLDSEGIVRETADGATRYFPIKLDGTVSNTARAIAVNTAIIGFFDRYPRIPYCRQSAFTQKNPELWMQVLPYIQKVSRLFKEHAPAQFEAQRAFVEQVHPDFVIPGSIFTTLTINRDWQTACHQDAGDFRSGLGCMSALEGGKYTGAELIFPKYRAAVDMRTGGVCLADVHEIHGNAPIVGTPGQYVRISAVFYCREAMIQCGSKEFEHQRAIAIGDKLATRHATKTGKLF